MKEKVCNHTSRDIRAIASQLVNVWIDIFRKEKATSGGSKLLKQVTVSDMSRLKGRDLSSGSHSPSPVNNRKAHSKINKLEEINSARTGKHNQAMESKMEDSIMSEEEKAAFATAEAARAAALAAAKVCYSPIAISLVNPFTITRNMNYNQY